LALRARVGINVDAGDITGNDGTNREYVVSHDQSDFEITSGFRIWAPLLLYLGVFKSSFSIGDGFETGVRDQFDVNGNGLGFFTGAHYNKAPYIFKSSLSFSTYESNRFTKQTITQLAISVGLFF